MKILCQNETLRNKITHIVQDTWMRFARGEGEKEIANQGWSAVKSFSQETGAEGQNEPMLTTKSQVQDAQDSLTQLPFFFFQGLTR